jgi:hypothetical protein
MAENPDWDNRPLALLNPPPMIVTCLTSALGMTRCYISRMNRSTDSSKEPDKYRVLKGAAERASQKLPEEIHLIPAAGHQWTNPAAIEPYTTALQAIGFRNTGIYSVDVLPVLLQFLLKDSDRIYAVIYDHPKAGVWINFVVLFEDGTSITFTNTQDRGLEKRPGHPTVHVPGAAAGQLYPMVIAQCPRGARKALTPESIVAEFEKAWADHIQWRKSQGGISVTEAASVALSRGGQPTRVLRPERIHYITEQDGIAERDFKNALTKIFDSYAGVAKAYLVYLRYDESPEGSVALCLLSTSREMKLVEDASSVFKSQFRSGEHLDIMFVSPSQAARIEAVCKPFFIRY